MKSRGYRRKTRSLLRRNVRERGKTGLSKLLQQYNPGDRVLVKLNPSIHKGMPHRRFHGKVGIIESTRGQAYIVNVTQGKAVKEIIVRPEHLEPFQA
ncbi:MAG: 50S ribosomal protein L21e [Candidatus Bathyarchaeota archaeon]|nr:MAG: 50S ribosomal protein L21e [Candidatus Bathyarchaeota archaeon]